MKKQFYRNVAYKIRSNWFRKTWLRFFYSKHGLKFSDIKSYHADRYFIFRVNDIYIPSDLIDWPLSYDQLYKKALNESLFFYRCKEGDCAVDIGAGLGEETLVYSRMVGPGGKVFSIEASTAAFEVLDNVVKLNKLENARAFNMAVYKSNGSVTMEGDNFSYQVGFIKEDENSGNKIQAIRMSDFISSMGIDRIDLLKVNIEGAERYVIETLLDEQVENIRHVAIACHDFRFRKEGVEFFKTRELVENYLTGKGFEIQSRNTGVDYLDDWVYGKNKRFQ